MKQTTKGTASKLINTAISGVGLSPNHISAVNFPSVSAFIDY